MNWIQPLKQTILAFALALMLMGTVFSGAALAQSGNSATSFFSDVLRRVGSIFAPPGRIGTPTGRSAGGSGRGKQCPSVDQPLTALVPVLSVERDGSAVQSEAESAIASTYVWGTTLESNPTLWFYVPYQASEAVSSAKFMLLDAEKHPVLVQPIAIALSETPGVIGFRIPHALETDRLYNWYFSIVCDADRPSRNAGVRGWIQRVEPNVMLTAALEQTAPAKRHVVYAESGIWYDAVTALAENRRRNPQDAASQVDWAGLLEFLKLSALAPKPVTDCCTVTDVEENSSPFTR